MKKWLKKWLEPLETAWVGVIAHKLRSFLTMLGIVIGVGAVIALMSIGKGAETSIISSIQGLGTNLLFISPGATSESGVRTAFGSATSLTSEDAEAITAEIANVTLVAPTSSGSPAGSSRQSKYESQDNQHHACIPANA